MDTQNIKPKLNFLILKLLDNDEMKISAMS